ncbi:MAG: hypothetical protein CMJ18_15565 [Phycisphaeraceae bacterium]|nr:hypothetical protein [Phycisphaeraceae bacterium]
MIRGIRRLDDTTLRLGGMGDNWHTTWAVDDRQYTSLCDGSGWPDISGYTGHNYNTRVYAIEGDPPRSAFRHLPGFPDLLGEDSPNVNRYYGFGILALERSIYHFLSTPNHPFLEPGARFVGAKLIHSPDLGQTWLNQDGTPVRWESWADRGRDNMIFFEETDDAFSLITMLQMGRNYEHNTDGYAYLYAPNGNTEGTMNQLVLCRVPTGRVLDRASYAFYTGDGWSGDIDDRAPVHTFPSGWVNVKYHPYAWHPSVTYNAPLGCYMMTTWGMGTAPDGMWFAKPSYFGFWIADRPEGPWTQVHEETAWMPCGDRLAQAYQPQIIPKWIAPDGRSFWMAWTDFQKVDGEPIYYAFNLQKVEIETRG